MVSIPSTGKVPVVTVQEERATTVLALDIGGTKLATAVLDASGRLSGHLVEPARRHEGPAVMVPRLFELGRRSLAAAGVRDGDLASVGISCGGPLDAAAGVLLCPPHLPGWIDVGIGALAQTEFGVPFALENDATAAALGQWRFGVGRGSSTMLYLTLSTGVGGGSIIDGRLHRGAAGNGGELGHLLVRSDGRPCLSCGRRGCLEAYCSGTNIAERAREALAAGTPSSLARRDPVTAKDVAEAAAAGDPVARAVWDETTALLGSALTDLTNVFEPDLIVLGGGVSNAGAMLLDPVRTLVADQAMRPAAAACTIVLADQPDLAGVLGAGAIGLERAEGADRLPRGQDAVHAAR